MQKFIAELSSILDKGEFEKAWMSDSSVDPSFTVDFGFAGRTVSISIESSHTDRWQSDSFHQAFSKAVRRVDQNCNIRWI